MAPQIFAAGTALAAALLPLPAQQAPTPAEMLAIADAFDRAQLSKDAAALARLVADDLVFIEASGKRTDKRAFIAGWTAAGDRYDPVVLADRRLVPLGARAFAVTAEARLSGTSDGARFASAFRFTDTFRYSDGRWQAVHIQVTRLPAVK
jgi:ketosteroid isomerase-like protein